MHPLSTLLMYLNVLLGCAAAVPCNAMQTPTDEDVFFVQDSAVTAAAPVTTILTSAFPLDKVRLFWLLHAHRVL